MKYFFIFMNYGVYDKVCHRMSIGGVQTYMYDLALIAHDRGFKPVIIEMNNVGLSDRYCVDHIEIWQISKNKRRYFQPCFNEIYRSFNHKDNLFVISTDNLDIKCVAKNVISIQHGIAFDEPIEGWKKIIIKPLRIIKNIWRCLMVENTVCVDYNYYNWFRACYTLPSNHSMKIIPNYSSSRISHDELIEKLVKTKQRKIVFSRRFVEHRGTIIFVNAIKKLLNEYTDLDVTFAGEGPLKEYITAEFKNESRVHIASYSATESIQFHSLFDIAVIPTVFSEGTSLSLLEAMSAGCYPIASCVGGLSNILIDGFNGTMILPSEQELYKSLKATLDMSNEDFVDVVKNAYNTATYGFSKKKWEAEWNSYLDSLLNNDK